MLLIPLVSAPTVVALAGAAERRWGSAAVGWLAAMPTTLPIAILAVAVELGDPAGATMALSAAAHVGAQVAFAVTFAQVMLRRGVLCGVAAGAAAFACLSLLIGTIPAPVAAAAAIPALLVGPKLLADRHAAARTRRSRRRHRDTALACAGALLLVGAALVTARMAGPVAAGAIGAFPALSTALALVVGRETGARAAAATLQGVIRGLPCYLAFCLVVPVAAPLVGTPAAVVMAAAACVATCGLTWRSVYSGSARGAAGARA